MNNKIQKAFGNIRAEESLKTHTIAFLCEKIRANNKTSYKNPVRRYSLVFTTLLFLFFVGKYSYGLYFTTSTFIDIDVNPAIELSLNRFYRVIGASAYNGDGEKIISNLNLTHKNYGDAVSLIVDDMMSKGYITDNSLVSVTFQSNNNDKEILLLGGLQNSVSVTLQSHHSVTEIEVYSVDSATRTHAHDLNITPAKYLAILELQNADPTVTAESCTGYSINELREMVTSHKNGHHGNGNVADESIETPNSKTNTPKDSNPHNRDETINHEIPKQEEQSNQGSHGHGESKKSGH